jgi:hypothetical protein
MPLQTSSPGRTSRNMRSPRWRPGNERKDARTRWARQRDTAPSRRAVRALRRAFGKSDVRSCRADEDDVAARSPFKPVVSRLLDASIWGDTTDQTFASSSLPPDIPSRPTSVEAFVRAATQKSAPSSA